VQFGYGLNYLIDIENAVIVDVEVTPAQLRHQRLVFAAMRDAVLARRLC
jgi:hypothetical protein